MEAERGSLDTSAVRVEAKNIENEIIKRKRKRGAEAERAILEVEGAREEEVLRRGEEKVDSRVGS